MRLEKKRFEKPMTLQKINRRGQIPKQLDHDDSATSIPVPTGGPVNSIWKGFRIFYVTASFYLLWVDRLNQPRGKRGKNDEAL